MNKIKKKNTLKPQDSVRKKYDKGPFDKSFYPNWSDQIFKVKDIRDLPVKPVYKVDNQNNEPIPKRFYPEEIQKINENLYRVKKILKKRTINGKKQCFIKWLNYPDNYNSWIDENDLIRLS